ncbi:sulfurtransferase [Paludisphaera soli]|uniref:sulfurtransferase n=1 Tax=Paludisphaera soli TaxID=2712865 RepID=UPI0013EB4186|nr:sulfurtransferase [Paludisphaera soli]
MLLTILQSLALMLLPVSLIDDGEAPASAATLVGFEELQARLGEPNLRLIDARPRPDYDKGHIPGAVWVDAKAVEAMAAKPGALTDRTAWEDWIRPLGIGPETKVLVYDAKRQLDAARLWWLLGYLGVDRVGLVDGGFPAWAAEGRPVAVEVPAVEPLAFSVKFRPGRRASRAEVLSAIDAKSMRIIDARTEAEYTGEDKKSRRGGHIPEACHLEWQGFVTPEGKFLPVEELRAKLEKAGVRPGEPVITHCQGGGRASVDAFVFERLGHPARNYYESWADWGNVDDTPIETGPAKK